MQDWRGRVIAGCRLAEEIGRGALSIVYRAYQPQLERWVAIKVLPTAASGGEEFLARFRREARAIAALRHPNILTVYDYGEQHDIAYIVMEYVAGGTLKSRLTGRPLEWPDAATLILPVGRALAYAHSQSIVHRDVKPANILLAQDDWPLLADFGLAKVLGRDGGITQPGITIGTPAYFSPEQAAGDEVDHRTDIYGLAAVLYELLTGHLPFEAATPIEMMLRRLREPPLPPRALNPHISPALERLLMRALSLNPAARHATMEELVEDLARLPGATGRPVYPPAVAGATGPTVRLQQPTATTGAHLVIASTGATLPLPPRDIVLVGRADPRAGPPPDVDLGPHGGAAAGVSRQHARLCRYPEGWLVEDLHSTNGTYVNDVRVAPGAPAPLRHGDRLRFGQLTVGFQER